MIVTTLLEQKVSSTSRLEGDKSVVSYSREDHLTFISQYAQAIIVGLMLDKQDEDDVFGLT